jgi:hypothetical protein
MATKPSRSSQKQLGNVKQGSTRTARPHIDFSTAALAALHPETKGRDLDLVGIVIDADDCLAQASVVEALNRKTAYPKLAHVAEPHRRASFMVVFVGSNQSLSSRDQARAWRVLRTPRLSIDSVWLS